MQGGETNPTTDSNQQAVNVRVTVAHDFEALRARRLASRREACGQFGVPQRLLPEPPLTRTPGMVFNARFSFVIASIAARR